MDDMDALKKKEFCMVIYDLDLQTSFNVTVHSLTIDSKIGSRDDKICPRLGFY